MRRRDTCIRTRQDEARQDKTRQQDEDRHSSRMGRPRSQTHRCAASAYGLLLETIKHSHYSLRALSSSICAHPFDQHKRKLDTRSLTSDKWIRYPTRSGTNEDFSCRLDPLYTVRNISKGLQSRSRSAGTHPTTDAQALLVILYTGRHIICDNVIVVVL